MKSLSTLLMGAALLAACKAPKPEVQGPPPPQASPEQGPVLGLGAGEEATPVQEPPPKEWGPPTPDDDGWFWIRMKNGEWFKGDLKVLRKDSVEFESDEVGDLNLDFDDIAVLRSSSAVTVRLDDQRILVGTLLLQDGVAKMQTDAGEETFPRGEVYTIIPGRPGDRTRLWSGKLSIGFTGRKGNTDQSDASLFFEAKRRTAKSRFTFTYNAIYSDSRGATTANLHRIDTDFRYFVDRRTYIVPIALSLMRDPFQNIELQATPGFGIGYTLVDESKLEWDADAGLGALYTKYQMVQPGEPSELTSAALLLGTGFHDDLTADLEFDLTYNLQLPFDYRKPNHHAQLRASLDLWKDVDFDVSLLWIHQGTTFPDNQGNTPLNDDYTLTFGLGWDF